MAETLDNLDDALFGDFEDYLAGTLPEARRREVDARLKASPEARALLAEFTEAQTLFQSPVWDVPEPVALPSAQALLDRAKSRPTARKSFLAGIKDWFGVAMWRPALASGFAVALLASGTWLVFRSNQNQKTESVAREKQNAPTFYGDRPTPAAPSAQSAPATSPAGDVNTSGKMADSRDGKLDATEKRADVPTNGPEMRPLAVPELEKAGDAPDGVTADKRASDDETARRDRAPESKPEAPKTAPPPPPVTTGSSTGMAGGVPASPQPAPKTVQPTPTTEEARGGEGVTKEDVDANLSANRAAKPTKKKDSRGGPFASNSGPNSQNQTRNAEPAPARRQSVGLTVADRDPAIGQLKSIAGQFGGTISINGSSIEIVVPGDKVAACAARVRQLNQSELKKDRDQAPKDTDTKQEPAPAVRLNVTVKEKPE